MSRNEIEMTVEKLNDHIKSQPEFSSNFDFDKSKTEDYIVKYVKGQEDLLWDDLLAKYPYFRFRGTPVSEDVAMSIILKTDKSYSNNEVNESGPASIDNLDLVNDWNNNQVGWMHPDGTVGYNGITTRYPDYSELLNEIIRIKLDFPFLEFMVAFSFWNCEPMYVFELSRKIEKDLGYEAAEDWKHRELYPDFHENIELLIYAHDKTFEVFWNNEAQEVYTELLPKLENQPELKYVNSYYRVFEPNESKVGLGSLKNNIPYYDSVNDCWCCIFPDRDITKEEGSIDYIVSEFTNEGLIYHYTVDNEVSHEHSFNAVLEIVMMNYNTFSIDGYEEEYSVQEINLINKLIEKLKETEKAGKGT